MFLNENSKVETTTLDNPIIGGYKILFVIGVAMIVIPIARVIHMEIKFRRRKKSQVQKRIDYLLDRQRAETMTAEQFNATMAEASALIASKAMGLLSEEELLRVQAEICGQGEK